MEEVLKQILDELKRTNNRLESLEQGQSKVEQSQSKFEQQVSKLEQSQSKLEQQVSKLGEGQSKLEQQVSKLGEGQSKLWKGQTKLEEGQIRLEQGQQRIEKRLNVIFEQTAGLAEFRTETLQRLDNIDAKFDILAAEMGKQKIDIELLKKRPV